MARIRSQVMVGRDADLAALLEVVDGARQGRPQLAIVTGEAGIGKSRLVQELVATLDDALVVVGHGVGLTSGELPFGVVSDALADLLRQRPDSLTAQERDQLRPLLPGGRGEVSTDRARLLTGVVALLERLSAHGLVCWVVEDVQWADPATRDVVSILARRAHGQLAVVVTARTVAGERDEGAASYLEDLARLPAARRICLGRLTTHDVQRQLADLVDEPLPRGVAQRIVEIGDGVPFVVEELAGARGRPELSTAAAVAEARLGSLSGSARRLVEAAAVGDGHLQWPLLDAVVGLAPEELDEALMAAIRVGILEETTSRDGCRFRHALLRDAADRAIPPAARRAWHRRWAEAIESHPTLVAPDPALLATAHHWHEAGDAEKSALAAAAAADAARRTGSGTEELELWARMLELWPKAGHVLEEAGVDHHVVVAFILRLSVSSGTRTIRCLEQVEANAIDEIERVVCRVWRHGTRYGKSFEPAAWSGAFLDEHEEMLRAALPDLLAQTALMLATGFTDVSDPRGDAILVEMEELARAVGDSHSELICAKLHSFRMFARGEVEASVARLEAVLARVEDVSVFQLWTADGNQIWSLAQLGRYDDAEAVIARAMSRVSDPYSLGVPFDHIAENACYVWICTGQWARAEDLVRSAKPYWGAGPHCSDVYLAELELLRTGRLSDVERWTALMSESPPMAPDVDWITETVAWHHGCAGDLEAMRRTLEPVWDAAHPVATNELWPAVLRAIRIEADAAVRRRDAADRPRAEAHLARVSEVADLLHRRGPVSRAWTAELAAQQARFRGEPSRALFVEAVEAWETVGHPYDAAAARLCLAEAALAEGDRDAARGLAEASLAVARDLGAAPLAAAAEEFLVRYRLGSRSVEEPGKAGSLTGREREVLALLAEGRTNEQIATELFMSPKTASVHVSRIIAKLGASNRTEAAAVARRAGLV